MFSSQSEQFSYQNQTIIYFTESLIKSIIAHDADTIRYKDIVDYISDEFNNLDFQTPFFVIQADLTETFCTVTPALKEKLPDYVEKTQRVGLPSGDNKNKSIIDRLREDAKRCCSQEEALDVVNSIQSKMVASGMSVNLRELYTFAARAETSMPPGAEKIWTWLEQNRDDKNYFVKSTTRIETIQKLVPKNRLWNGLIGLNLSPTDDDYKVVDENRTVVAGYSFTICLFRTFG
jgi:hypothetical protein